MKKAIVFSGHVVFVENLSYEDANEILSNVPDEVNKHFIVSMNSQKNHKWRIVGIPITIANAFIKNPKSFILNLGELNWDGRGDK